MDGLEHGPPGFTGLGAGLLPVSVGCGIPIHGFPGGRDVLRRIFPPARLLGPASRVQFVPLASGWVRPLGPSGPPQGRLFTPCLLAEGLPSPMPLCMPSPTCQSHSLALVCDVSLPPLPTPSRPSGLADPAWASFSLQGWSGA